jgi:tRNA(Ile2) C34 agmatinyltransferase TiaS
MSANHSEPETTKVVSCNFCSKLLGKEYYFRCHICGATYCYIHMTKHSRAHKPPMPYPFSG